MLKVECPDRLAAARAHARTLGAAAELSLEENLRRLGDLYGPATAVTVLHPDHAPHSFTFVTCKRKEGTRDEPQGAALIVGGLLFYGPGDSGVAGPQFSVTTSGRTDARWEIHT